jgi:CRISPR-associated protein Cmr2
MTHKTDYTKKIAAWLHDPAEKQLVLMRDKEGHEGGTSRRLRQALEISSKLFDKRADHLAAAADRPNWPRGDDAKRYPKFEAVHFTKDPELIHPLSGECLKLGPLNLDIGVDSIKAVSQNHFESLIQEDDEKAGEELRKTFLAFWRFGPEAGKSADQLGVLWNMLPADSRTPDHSIWSHVDTVSAIHTALAGDETGPDQPALLVMSFGPVQGFIGQARSTSDLWAGSHLLSSLVWEAMQPIVSHLGPDCMVFPALRGVPVVDRWLMQRDVGGDAFVQLFENIDSELLADRTDTNPLFAASLPNKFMAIVPSKQAAALAERAVAAIKNAAKLWTREAAQRAFDAAGVPMTDATHAQIDQQLRGFPEAYWAAAIWPVGSAEEQDKGLTTASGQLHAALDQIHPDLKTQGVFQESTWKVLTKELKLDGLQFWAPNTGILYPAVYELVERTLGAAKATRPFAPLLEAGHRCTLTGEAEWLTHDRTLLGLNRKDREAQSVWGRLAKKKKSWVKPGEHLGAIATLKRLWPTMFAERISDLTGGTVRRFVVSTHALALSTTLEKLADPAQPLTTDQRSALQALAATAADYDNVTLPKALLRTLYQRGQLSETEQVTLRKLPDMLDNTPDDAAQAQHLERTIHQLLGDSRPETYYALILMDGDRMGGWLAGNEDDYKLKYRETWHSSVLAEMQNLETREKHLKEQGDAVRRYLDTKRPVSPGRHGVISQALNDFSTHLARHVVEDCCKGKLLYAGGDDVLALVAVDDLFDCMQLLRLAYSGIAPSDAMQLGERIGTLQPGGNARQRKLLLAKGFGLLGGRLMTLMGHKATASMGAVVAHHSAPLGLVLRELRAAESRAKNTPRGKNGKGEDINRDAFCLRVLKRGGGEVNVTSPWWPVNTATQQPDTSQSALALMKQLAEQLALTDFSRGAIFKAQLWFEGLTDDAKDSKSVVWRDQMTSSLAYQFKRQKGSAELARQVVDFVCDVMHPAHPKTAIENFLVTSEFFAREARSFQDIARQIKHEAKTQNPREEAAA